MNRYFKRISFLFCQLLAFLLCMGFTSSGVDTKKWNELSVTEKVYSHATLDEEFEGNSVLVVMDRKTGGINKKHNTSFFGDIEISRIVDLTAITPSEEKYIQMKERASMLKSVEKIQQREGIDYVSTEEKMLEVDPETFCQILKIELSENSKENVLEVIKHLEKIEGIKYAGPNYIDYLDTTPNDPNFTNQWALQTNRMNSQRAWDVTTGTRTVRVGIMDTGIANHPDLNANLVEGYDFVHDNKVTNDDSDGHGTHVAGIIGAVGNNAAGIAGVCWNVSLVPLQIVNSTGGFTEDAQIKAITYAINNNISVINYSGGGTSNSYPRSQMIANYPGLFICAAGNQNSNNDMVSYEPANRSSTLTNVISVGATDSNDVRSSFSNFGFKNVNLFAPGSNILSTYPQVLASSGYKSMSGTSMATPYVTGAAALVMSLRPDFTVQEVKNCILNSVDIISGLSTLCTAGGRLNAFKAVQMATEPQTFTGDVNGDGRADMIVQWRDYANDKRNLLVYEATSEGKYKYGRNFVSVRTQQPIIFPAQFFVADVNNDGRDDFIVKWKRGNNISFLTYLGTISSEVTTSDVTTATFFEGQYTDPDNAIPYFNFN